MMLLLLGLITLILAGISLTLISNIALFPRLRAPGKQPDPHPLVSVMIPARNEAASIDHTVTRLLKQDYTEFEIIVLDDNSSDATATIVQDIARTNPKVTLMTGQALPAGWMGKNWACHQMAGAARGDYLIFTDADVRWEPTALGAVVSSMNTHQTDLFTVWPTQHTESLAERLCVPLMAFAILAYLPVIGAHYTSWSIFAAANGQCMAWKRKAYESTGGHAQVADNILEDVTLARIAKAAGFNVRMADGNNLISCRMYNDWPSVRDGFAKNILAGYGNSVTLLTGASLFHWLLFLVPWVLLGAGFFIDLAYWPQWPALLAITGLCIRAITAAFTHQRVMDALFMPISVVLMSRIAAQAIWWHFVHGGPKWKDRVIRRSSAARQKHG